MQTKMIAFLVKAPQDEDLSFRAVNLTQIEWKIKSNFGHIMNMRVFNIGDEDVTVVKAEGLHINTFFKSGVFYYQIANYSQLWNNYLSYLYNKQEPVNIVKNYLAKPLEKTGEWQVWTLGNINMQGNHTKLVIAIFY